jgi:hypothetical protein
METFQEIARRQRAEERARKARREWDARRAGKLAQDLRVLNAMDLLAAGRG